MSGLKTLVDLNTNETAVIENCDHSGFGSTRLQEMGLIPGNFVRLIKKSPFSGPIEIKLHGFYLSLRKDLAQKIQIRILI